MFHTLETKSASKVILGLAAGLIITGSAAAAFAQSQSCPVTFALNGTTTNALQFTATYGAPPAGAFPAVGGGCTGLPSGLADVVADADSITVAWANNATAFTGPGAFATCTFIGTAPPVTLVPGDFAVTVDDCSAGVAPPAACAPPAAIVVTVGACTDVPSACGNGVVEAGEDCDGGASCTGHCTFKGSCGETPLVGCKGGAAGGSKVLLKNSAGTTKDSGQYQLKKGDATDLADFKDPTTAGETISWCVYDADGLVSGLDVASGGASWVASGTKGFQYKSATDPAGVSQIKLTSGVVGKAAVSIKAKSKAGNYTGPSVPLNGTVTSQLVIDDGVSPVCFSTAFTTPTKNDVKQYNSKGP